MAKKILNRFIILLSSLALLISVTVAIACSWWDPDEELQAAVMMAPESSKLPEFSLFYLSNNRYYGYNDYENYNPEGDPYEKINVAEWHAYFGKKVSEDDVHTFIYVSDEKSLVRYREAIASKSNNASGDLDMFNAGVKKLEPALTYLEAAYKVNALCASTYNDWYEYAEPDPSQILSLTEELKKLYAGAKEPFLKQRYVFLLQRIYHTGGLYSHCIELFNKEAVKYDQSSSIYLRSMGYKAASLYKQQEYSEANYIYALMFSRMPAARVSAHWSFHPQEEADWNESLALAKTGEEKCALWLLFGITADAERALKEIYDINPSFAPARMLATRAVNYVEATSGDGNRFYYEKPHDNDSFIRTLSSYATNKSTPDPAFWHLMTAYMYYQSGNTGETEKWLASGRKVLGKEDKLLQDHYTLTEMLVRVKTSTTVNDKLQRDLAAFLTFNWCAENKEMRKDAIYEYFMNMLDKIYTTEKNDIMVALCNNNSGEFYKGNLAFIDRMLKFMQQTGHNELETLLLSKYFLNANDLIEEKGLIYLYHYDLDKANKEFSLLSGTAQLPGNPFNIRINDCHDCDHEMAQKTIYTKTSLVQKLIEMEAAAQKDPKASAQTYFLLANAYYNITYFGNNRRMYESTLFGTGYDSYGYYFSFGQVPKPDPIKNIFSCAKAEAYYMLAYKYAPNKEFEAKCLFMAAKCEQNAFYLSGDFDQGATDFRAGKYFRSLKDRYYDTKYFKEVIHECGYFDSYIKQNPR